MTKKIIAILFSFLVLFATPGCWAEAGSLIGSLGEIRVSVSSSADNAIQASALLNGSVSAIGSVSIADKEASQKDVQALQKADQNGTQTGAVIAQSVELTSRQDAQLSQNVSPNGIQGRPGAAEDALSEAALVGRWGNSGVKYGFSDDGYFYRSTVLSHLNTRSIYHSGTYNTYVSGNYLVRESTPGWWEYQYYTTYTYLNTLFGQYRVRGRVIQFDNVVSISHSNFDREWHNRKTRGPDDENFLAKFQKAVFDGDTVAEFEFINPSRLRLCDKSTDRDFFWDFEEVPRNVPIPTHVIPPVEWPARNFSPEMPELKTKGRLRESDVDVEERKTKLIIDKTDSLADIREYVKTLRGAAWWVEEPGTGDSLNLEARKGMWRLTMKSGNGSNTNADTVVLEAVNYPEGKWPQEWTKAGLEPPQKSVIVGNVDNKVSESDKAINERLFFDRVNDSGVEDYAEWLNRSGYKVPQNTGDNWKYYKYIRVNSDLYRVEVSREGRYGEITEFLYNFKYFPDGVWPAIWREGGLPVPEGYETIVGEIEMEKWDNKAEWYGSFSRYIKFLGLEQYKIDSYFSKLQSAGFTRKEEQYSDRVTYYNYLRIDGSLYRVELEQRENDELAEISYTFNYLEDGVWPAIWREGGLPVPEGINTIAGAIDMEKWDNKAEWYGSFSRSIKFLGLDKRGIDSYFSKLQTVGFLRKEQQYSDRIIYVNHLRLGDGSLYRVEVEQRENDEITEIYYSFNYFEDGVWPAIWRDGGLPAPDGAEAIVGAIDMEKWDNKPEWYGSFSRSIKFLGLSDRESDDYLSKLQSVGFIRKEERYSDRITYVNHLRLGDGSLYRVEVEKSENDEIAVLRYVFNYFEDGEWPAVWRDGGLPAPDGGKAIVGAIDMKKWDNRAEWYGSFSSSIKFISLSARGLDDYLRKLQSAGFQRKEEQYSDRVSYVNYLRLGGDLYRVEIEKRENDEIAEINYAFNYYEDGVWPAIWREGGLPAPEGSEAIVGAINMEYWNMKSNGDSFSTSVKFLDKSARVADDYFKELQTAGFTSRKNYSDEETLYNYLHFDGSLCRVVVEKRENNELTEMYYSFRCFDEGEWPAMWREGGLPAPYGYEAIVGAIDMDNWDMKSSGDSFYTYAKFLGLSALNIELYFSLLQAAGFVKEESYGDTVILHNYLRFGGSLCYVRIEKRENDELTEIYYNFRSYEDGEWPAEWQSLGIPAPQYFAIVGAFELEDWNDKGNWNGSFRTSMKFWDADLNDYVKVLKQNGFTEPENTYRAWELEKRVRIGGVWYIVTVYDNGNNEMPEVRYEFREESK